MRVGSVSRWLAGPLGALLMISMDAQAGVEKGLVLRLEGPTGTMDARQSRTVTLHVPPGQSPSPFLDRGAFKARWEGKMVLEKRSRLVFHLEGTGKARLLIDGELMVSAIGTPSESERLRNRASDRYMERPH